MSRGAADVLLVTGGTSGIGLAVVEAAVRVGVKVAVLDLHPRPDVLASIGPGILSVACDVSVEREVARSVDEVTASVGAPNLLFTAAGVDLGGLVHEMPFERWRQVLSVNLDGTFLVCKYVIAKMLELDIRGSVVCCSSPAASVALASGGTAAYSASKGAVSALVRCLAIDYASAGIRVNGVVPGATETPLMWANVSDSDMVGMRAQLAKEIPLARIATTGEVAAAVMWLLSESSSYVTGSHLVCDGGILAKGSISV